MNFPTDIFIADKLFDLSAFHYIFRDSRPAVLKKRCSENMQQIYRRMPLPKCDLKKLLSNFIEIELWYGCSPIHSLHIFRTFFAKSTSGRLLLHFVSYWCYSYHIFTLFKNDHVLVTLHNNVFLKKLKVSFNSAGFSIL